MDIPELLCDIFISSCLIKFLLLHVHMRDGEQIGESDEPCFDDAKYNSLHQELLEFIMCKMVGLTVLVRRLWRYYYHYQLIHRQIPTIKQIFRKSSALYILNSNEMPMTSFGYFNSVSLICSF